MKKDYFINKYEAYRETAKILSFCLVFVSICFLISMYFNYQLSKNQRIIVIPPGADKRIEISYDYIDTDTLKLWSKYITSLFLNYTPASYTDQVNDLLKLTTPEFYKKLESVLLDNQKDIETLKVSSTFFPTEFKVNRAKKELIINGDRFLIVGSEPITKKEEVYVFNYEIINGKFCIDGIYKEK